jgi:hypothetical protein
LQIRAKSANTAPNPAAINMIVVTQPEAVLIAKYMMRLYAIASRHIPKKTKATIVESLEI